MFCELQMFYLVTGVQGIQQSHEPQGRQLTMYSQPVVLNLQGEGEAGHQDLGTMEEGT